VAGHLGARPFVYPNVPASVNATRVVALPDTAIRDAVTWGDVSS
jgi:hypothetical protein